MTHSVLRNQCQPSLVKQTFDFLYNHCTCENGGKQKFVIEFSKLLNHALLHPNSNRSVQDIWKSSWEKPFFSNIKASIAGPQVNNARNYFEKNLKAIQSKNWEISRISRSQYDYRGTEVQAATGNIHPLPVGLTQPLKHPCAGERLWRARKLAKSLDSSSSAIYIADQAYLTWFKTTPHSNPSIRGLARTYGDQFIKALDAVPGFAYTTACHVAADLGYPYYKMDLWIRGVTLAIPNVCDAICTHYKIPPNSLPIGLLNPGNTNTRAFMLHILDKLTDDFVEPIPEPMSLS